MRLRPFYLVALALGFLLAGCASMVNQIPAVTPQMTSASGQSVGVLEHGRQLYAGPCSSCHAPQPMNKFSPAQWNKIIADMAGRARFSAAEHDAVLAYVMAARPFAPAQQ